MRLGVAEYKSIYLKLSDSERLEFEQLCKTRNWVLPGLNEGGSKVDEKRARRGGVIG